MTKEAEEIKNRLSNIGEAIGNIALEYIIKLEKENTELKKEVEEHKWNDIFLEDCAGYDKKIAEEYTTLQERIEKLEQENAELKENNRVCCEGNGETLVVNVSFDSFTRVNANHKMYYPHNSVKNIEKENTELKEQNQKLLGSCEGATMMYEHLTKAKEIIKNLMEFAEMDCREYEEEYKEAEQFLKEE